MSAQALTVSDAEQMDRHLQDASASPEQKIANALTLLGKGNRTPAEMRALILGLEAAMQAMPGYVPGAEFKTTHHFAPGMYMRECLIPKGMVVTGEIHKTEHLNILSQGKLTVWTEDGMKTLSASTVVKSMPGIKRVGYAHEDAVWITVHPNTTNERDIKAIEGMLLAKSFEEVFGPEAPAQIHGGNEPCPQ